MRRRLSHWLALVALLVVTSGCGAGRARSADDVGPTWTLHAFDVGTGLAILVRGPDFTLLYDGGSNDDRAIGPENRLLAYLAQVLGPSGGSDCRMRDESTYPLRSITHIVLSHPHRDHVQLLPDVAHCYAVEHAWDSGALSKGLAYDAFLASIAASPTTTYHSARPLLPTGHVGSRSVKLDPRKIRSFKVGDVIALGTRARATVLHVRYAVKDPNDASVVLRLDLGRASVLLTGDITAGPRAAPESPPRRGSGEADLLNRHRGALDVDILQVAHHGSLTSSRAAFLDAVSPRWAIVSSGPTRFGPVTLPDRQVIDALAQRGIQVRRTDDDDAGCGARQDKVGVPRDGKPGGCSAIRLTIRANGAIVEDMKEAKEANERRKANE
jgi:competence protein ComEC